MIQFFKYWKLYLSVSVVTILAGVIAAGMWGYHISIDFAGGTNLQYAFSSRISQNDIERSFSQAGVTVARIEELSPQTFQLRTEAMTEQQEATLRSSIETSYQTSITVLRQETVGPVIGAETIQKTLVAVGIAGIGILIYIAFAFRNLNYALATIIAIVHDVLVVAGVYAFLSHFFGAEIDLLFVTAILTTMAFSVHDTIVVFDQMREYRKESGRSDIVSLADKAVTTTMVRSLNNSFTIVFMLVALMLLGGETIRFFAATLLVGTVTGTYSSPFVSVPIAVWLERMKKT